MAVFAAVAAVAALAYPALGGSYAPTLASFTVHGGQGNSESGFLLPVTANERVTPEPYRAGETRSPPVNIQPEYPPPPAGAPKDPIDDGHFFGTGLSVQAEIAFSGGDLEFAFGALWTMTGPKLLRIDGAENSVTSFWIPGATGETRGIVADADALWLPDVRAQSIYKFDPQSRRVSLKIHANMRGRDGNIAVADGSVWVITDNDRLLERFSAETGEAQAAVPLPSDGVSVALLSGSVWVTAYNKGELYRIDPTTNSVAEAISVGLKPHFICPGFGSLWLFSDDKSTIQRIDPWSGRVLAFLQLREESLRTPIRMRLHLADMTTGGGFVWITVAGMPLAQIDPGANRIVREFQAPRFGAALRYGAGSLWFSSGVLIYRVEPPGRPE